VGGAEVAIKEITDRISPAEVEFDMVTLRLDSRLPLTEKIGNVNVHRVGYSVRHEFSADSLPWYLNVNKYFFLITGVRKALALNKARKYDATWSLMATYSSFAAVIFKMLKPRIPFIFTLQDGDPIPYIKRRGMPLYPLFKMMFTHADHIQTISKYLADWAKDMGAKCPITVVPNAVDLELFSKPLLPAEAEALKKKLGKKEGDIFLIHTGRLVVKNAVGDIISALQYLPENVKLLLIGQGYQEDLLREQAAKLASRHEALNDAMGSKASNPSDRVIFLGFISHKDMPPYLHVSDIFVRPSLSEGFGNSFIEAMAAGIPVIATPVGGITDFLTDGETGLFCEVNNPKSIAQKVGKLIKDKESREYIVGQARKMVEDKYQWSRITGEMKKILEEV
jgi:glycosyltransferase involved in cell wall biosynthesis